MSNPVSLYLSGLGIRGVVAATGQSYCRVWRTLSNAGVRMRSAADYRRSQCAHGHPFTPENTYVRQDLPTPVRVCRACVRNRSRDRWERIKAERHREERA